MAVERGLGRFQELSQELRVGGHTGTGLGEETISGRGSSECQGPEGTRAWHVQTWWEGGAGWGGAGL